MIDLDKLATEVITAWERVNESKACFTPVHVAEVIDALMSGEEHGDYEICENVCEGMACLTGARFNWGFRSWELSSPDRRIDWHCAEALIAQWEGLSPPVVMERSKR